jgi:hypothetical protein
MPSLTPDSESRLTRELEREECGVQ